MRWRSVFAPSYTSAPNNLLGKRVTSATLTLTAQTGSVAGSQTVAVQWAEQNGFHDAVAPRTLPAPYPYGNSLFVWRRRASSRDPRGDAG